MVLGAGLVAANLSTIFRLRKFGMTDKVPYTVTFRLDGAAEQGAEGSEAPAPAEDRVLVPALKKVPTRRAIALHNLTTDSFSVELKLDNSAGAVLPCCQRRDPLGAFTVSGIAAVVEKYGSSGKVALHTAVDQSGVFKLDKADATVEVDAAIPEPAAETNTTTPEGTAESNTTTDAAAGDKPKAEKEDEKKKEEEPAQPAAPTQGKKRTTRVPLNVTGSLALPGLSTEQMAAARRTLRALRERDNAKRETAKARNDLESYIISTRDKLESREDLQAASTEEERDGLRSALADAEDWLYGDGDSASAAEYRAKLKALRKGGDAIEERAAEAEARPKVTKAALDFVELALKAANAWPTIKPWLNETEVEAAVKSIEEFRDWVKTSMEAQEKKKPHEDPAFTTRELARRMDATRRVFTRLNNKPKPVVKPPPAPVDEKNGTTAGNGTEAKPETIPEGDAEEGAAADGGAEAGTEGAGKPAAAGEEKGEADAKEHDEL